MINRLKLSSKLIMMFFLIILFYSIISVLTLTFIISKTNMNSMERQVQLTTEGVSKYLSKTVNDLQIKAKLLAGQDEIMNYTEYALYNMLTKKLLGYWDSLGADSIVVFSEELKPVTVLGEKIILDKKFKSTLKSSFEGKTLRFFTMGETNPLILITLPVKRNYKSFAVMAVGIKIDKEYIASLESIFRNNIIFRINNNVIVSNNFDPDIEHNLITYSPKDKIDRYLIKRIPSSYFYISGGVVYCLYDTSRVNKQIHRYIITSVLIFFVILSIVLFIAVIFYRQTFLKPFSVLMSGINQIADGNITPPFKNPGADEFGELASAFNLMCANLIKREEDISRLSSYNTLILNNMKSGLITFALDGGITTINPSAKKILFGKNDADNEPLNFNSAEIKNRFPVPFAQMIESELKNSEFKSYGEITIFDKTETDGDKPAQKVLSYRFSPLLEENGITIGLILVFEDVTRIKNLEEKLLVSERLAHLGEMAAGVAHQIKNPLAVMKVSMQMLLDDLGYPDDGSEVGDLSGFILNEIDTLDSVVNNFLFFANPKRGAKTYEKIEDLINFSLRGIPMDLYEDVNIIKEFSEEPAGKRLFDRNLIIQAFSNIIINALQASEPGGSIIIRTYSDNESLIIEIRDFGKGMDEQTLTKIYNPFFTTKDNGTGLGLSIVHRIVEDEGGTIQVESTLGKGTVFRVVFKKQ